MKEFRIQCFSSLFLDYFCSKTRSLWVWRSILRRRAHFQAWCLCDLACWPWDRWGLKEFDARSWLLLFKKSGQSYWSARKVLHCYSTPWIYKSFPHSELLRKSGRCSRGWGLAGAQSQAQLILQLPDPHLLRKFWLQQFRLWDDALPFVLSRNHRDPVFILSQFQKYLIRSQKHQAVFLWLWLRRVSALDWVLSSAAHVSLQFSPYWSQIIYNPVSSNHHKSCVTFVFSGFD